MMDEMDTSINSKQNVFIGMKAFPNIINGQLDIHKFLLASNDLISLVERLGAAFAPVKYDMQGNVQKILQSCHDQFNVCLFKLMASENDKVIRKDQNCATESVLWLNRAFLFFEITFQQILELLRQNKNDVSMTKIFSHAYEGSVKKYHNWVTQRLFHLICKVSPNLETTLTTLGMTDDKESFIAQLHAYTQALSVVRKSIDDYFKANNLFLEKQ